MTSDSDILLKRFSTERAERAIELAQLVRRVREAKLDFLRRHAAEESAIKAGGRRGEDGQLSDEESPQDRNRSFKQHRLKFDP